MDKTFIRHGVNEVLEVPVLMGRVFCDVFHRNEIKSFEFCDSL